MALHVNFSSEECISYSETLSIINQFCVEISNQLNTSIFYSGVCGEFIFARDEQGEIKPFNACRVSFLNNKREQILELMMDTEQVDHYREALEDKETLRELINQLPVRR